MSAVALDNCFEAFTQFVGDEHRIRFQHFGAPRNKVFDGSAGAMITRAKLKILHRIGGLIPSALVMNGFSRQQRSAEELFHDIAMLKNFAHRVSVLRWNSEQCVTAPNSARDLRKPVLLSINLAHPFIFALARAKLLFLVDAATSPASFRELPTAIFAHGNMLRVGVRLPPESGTRDRTVHGVFVVFSAVLRDGALGVAEWCAALLACKVNVLFALTASGWAAVRGLIGRSARFAAKLPISFSSAGNMEDSPALLACEVGVSLFSFGSGAILAAKTLMSFGGADAKGLPAIFAIFDKRHGEHSLCQSQQLHNGLSRPVCQVVGEGN